MSPLLCILYLQVAVPGVTRPYTLCLFPGQCTGTAVFPCGSILQDMADNICEGV